MNKKNIYTPKYKLFNIKASKKICSIAQDLSLKSQNKEKKRYGFELDLLIDAYSTVHRDKVAHEYFDAVISGEDVLINILVAFELSAKGKRVLIIHTESEYNLSSSVFKQIDEARFCLESSMMCSVISKYVGIENSKNIIDIIKNCFSEKNFSYGRSDLIPLISTGNKLYHYKDTNNVFFIDSGLESKKKEHKLLDVALLKLKRLNLIKGHKRQGFLEHTFIYETLIETSKIISTSRNSSDFDTCINHKMGSSYKPTETFENFTIADRIIEIKNAIDQARGM